MLSQGRWPSAIDQVILSGVRQYLERIHNSQRQRLCSHIIHVSQFKSVSDRMTAHAQPSPCTLTLVVSIHKHLAVTVVAQAIDRLPCWVLLLCPPHQILHLPMPVSVVNNLKRRGIRKFGLKHQLSAKSSSSGLGLTWARSNPFIA